MKAGAKDDKREEEETEILRGCFEGEYFEQDRRHNEGNTQIMLNVDN